MIVGINATCISSRPSGAKQRFLGIYSALVRNNPEIEFIIFEPVDYQVGKYFDFQNVTTVSTPLPSEGWLYRYYNGLGFWRKAFSKYRFDIFENINHALVRPPTGNLFLTTHDIRYIKNLSKNISNIFFAPAVWRSIRTADQIITVSESMKNEILSVFPNSKVSVIYNGIEYNDFNVVTLDKVEKVSKKYLLPNNFMLAVGHLEYRKNYGRLVDALFHLRKNGFTDKLVIVGNDSGAGMAIRNKVHDYKLGDDVIILNNLTDEELRCVYKLAKLFVFPSYYEGFGIPILEAMAAHIPMAMSNLPVFKEITENKSAYFPFDDSLKMAEVIAEMLVATQKRENQVKYGINRVLDFSFDSIAKNLEKLYFNN